MPGEENLDVVEALRRSTIELVLTRHEQAAAFMAATHGRLTGQPGVCLTHARARRIEPHHRRRLRAARRDADGDDHRAEGDPSRKQARFQIVDIVSTMTPLTKMARQIVAPRPFRRMVREAFRVAQQERPGPVHLELPEDIAHAAAPTWRRSRRIRSICRSRPAPRSTGRPQLIVDAERPLVMLGAAASRPRLADALSEFVRRLQIPFFNTQMGKGAVTGGSDLYMGTAALSERDYVHGRSTGPT